MTDRVNIDADPSDNFEPEEGAEVANVEPNEYVDDQNLVFSSRKGTSVAGTSG